MPHVRDDDLLRLPMPESGHLRRTLYSMVAPPLKNILCLDELNDIYRVIQNQGDVRVFIDRLLEEIAVSYVLSDEDREKIPAEGPAIAVANHPFGAVEGVILAHILTGVRPDVRIMANYLLSLIPDLARIFIPVDPFGTDKATAKNIGPLKESIRWVKRGGVLGVFPAGEVSTLNLKQRAITDKEWSPTVGRIVRITGAPVVPIFFRGTNRVLFHLLGLIHPRLRTVMLPREMLNKNREPIRVSVGAPIPSARLAAFTSDEEVTRFLRLRTYVLKNRDAAPMVAVPGSNAAKSEAVAPAIDAETLAREIDALPEEQVMLTSGEFRVVVARREQFPNVMLELGRLRELTFREVGEGTGRNRDLDEFDDYYLHLVLWNDATQEIAGAYRIGPTDEILARHGRKGFYTNTLFKLKQRFLDRIDPGLEMGRSFVRREYQKSYNALLLLWKGIGQFIAKNPRYVVLFGPVSISNDYRSFSRELIVRFLKANLSETAEKLVRPKTPPWLPPLPLAGLEIRTASQVVRNLDDLAALVSEVESDGKGVPVLLRHYLKLGGRLLAFNVDKDFADALDGLILVDLRRTDPKVLGRYMGRENAAAFRAHHGLDDAPPENTDGEA